MRRLPMLLAALVLVVAACGSDDGSDATTTSTAADEPTTTTVAGDAGDTATTSGAAGSASFTASDGTEARFMVDEVLRGQDETVVAANPGVTVDVGVDFEAGTVDVGVVTIDATAFRTDEDRRDGAINRFILDTSAHPTITFTPTDTSGLTTEGGTIVGDLTIREVTNEVVFEVTVAEATVNGISASATAEVDRTEWDLNIPSVPFVASVSETVTLELDLVLAPTG